MRRLESSRTSTHAVVNDMFRDFFCVHGISAVYHFISLGALFNSREVALIIINSPQNELNIIGKEKSSYANSW